MVRIAVIAATVVFGLASFPLAVLGQAQTVEEFISRNFSDEQFLLGEANEAPPVTINGTLRVPEGGAPPPVIILLHGTDGPQSTAVNVMREILTEKGYATVRLDSYSGRKIASISMDQGKISQFTQIYDAYRVVEAIADNPAIDADAIVLMGFSRGGTAALFAPMRRFHDWYGPRTGRIAAYVSLYPGCNFELEDELEVVDAPIREFHGAADDWTSAQTCGDFVGRLKAAGADIEITTYEGVRHAFFDLSASGPMRNPKFQSSINCVRREENGVLINPETGKRFSYEDDCVTYGPYSQYDETAARAAEAAIMALIEGL